MLNIICGIHLWIYVGYCNKISVVIELANGDINNFTACQIEFRCFMWTNFFVSKVCVHGIPWCKSFSGLTFLDTCICSSVCVIWIMSVWKGLLSFDISQVQWTYREEDQWVCPGNCGLRYLSVEVFVRWPWRLSAFIMCK
jgi:hypothetical protein